MTFGSVCSGIEAASEAWIPLGWTPRFVSEVEAFCCSLLKQKHPKVKNYGDFTTIGPDAGPIDVLVGGTPCQDFSVAGLRAGLAGDRGNLTLEFLRLAERLRSQWLVWENVPGVLSSVAHDAPDSRPPDIDLDAGNGPADGEEVLVEDEYDADERHAFACFLAGLQELGYGFAYRVLDAQYFGVPQRRRRVIVVGYLGDWRPAAAVLFERYSLSGDPAPRRESGQRVTGTISARTEGGGGLGTDFDLGGGLVPETSCFGGNNTGGAIDVATAVNAHGGPCGRMDFESETFVAAVAFNLRGREGGAMPEETDLASVRSASGGSSRTYVGTVAVRRLTPRECERLQGFPDDYTLITHRGKLAADGPRYKALGNSMAVPVMRWIGERIQLVSATL